MAMEVHGFIISSPFVFVCDGKVYRSQSGKNWTVIFSRYGTQAWGNDTYASQRVDRACPTNRNEEVRLAFRGAVMRHFKLNYTQIEAFFQRQIDEDKQILVEGNSVKRHVGGRSSYSTGSSSTTLSAPAPAPVKKESPHPALKHGCPASRLEEFLAWEKAHLGILNRVKMPQRVAMFLGTWEEPNAVKPEPVVAEEPQAEEPRAERSLAEEREHKEDVPFYGRRRRDQGKFREDVMLNCGGRCVYTNAIAVRCEAAHLKAHARKGGASFKNGLLLRADIHKLFDAGLCGIDPHTLKLWFAPDLVKKDADLAAIDGITMRKTLLPINKDNIEDRWDAFVKILLA